MFFMDFVVLIYDYIIIVIVKMSTRTRQTAQPRTSARITQKTRRSASRSKSAKQARTTSSKVAVPSSKSVLKIKPATAARPSAKNKTMSSRRVSVKQEAIAKSSSKTRSKRVETSSKRQKEQRADIIQKKRMPTIAEEEEDPNVAPRIPIESADVLMQIFGKIPADFGELARDLTEIQPPQTQGTNAYRLSKYIVNKGKKSKYYDRAMFFKNLYDSNKCYICGLTIEKGNKQEELEHVLPIGEALALTGIIQENKKDFEKKIEEIADHPISYMYLLEYARSHTCCNQAKGRHSFLKFNGSPPFKQPYSIDQVAIKTILKKIWINAGHGGDFQQFDYACASKNFVKDVGRIPMDKFIESRKEVIVRDFMTPIHKNIEEFIGANGAKFAQLVYLANQAVSVDEKVWKSLGTRWTGDIIPYNKMFFNVVENVVNDSYKGTREVVADQLFKLSQSNSEFNKILNSYYNSKKSEGRVSRVLDFKVFKTFIDVDFILFKELHQKYLASRTSEFEIYYGSESLFGIEYFYYLLTAQDAKFKFFESMEDSMVKMLRNINLYSIMYMMLFIIYYDPLSKGLPSSVEGLNNEIILKINEYGIVNYDMIQDNFITSVFQDFNYVVKPTGTSYYLNIQQMMNFTSHIAMTPTEMEVANILIGLKKKAKEEYGDIGDSL